MNAVLPRLSSAIAVILVAIAIWLQAHTPLNMDVAYYLRISPEMLGGTFWFGDDGPLFHSIYRVMNYFLYLPAGALVILLNWSDKLATNAYAFGLAALACVAQVRFCMALAEKYRSTIWLMLPAFVLFALIWPIEYFAQREHLFFLLIYPLVLDTVKRLALDRQHAISNDIWIGVSAGLGSAIKPQFALTWLLVRGYLHFAKRPGGARDFTVDIACASVLAVYYLVVVAIVLQVGIDNLVLGLYFYQSYFSPTWELILGRKLSLMWILAGTVFATAYLLAVADRSRSAFFAAFGAAFLQVILVKYWIDYHWYPAAAFAGLGIIYTSLSVRFEGASRIGSRLTGSAGRILFAGFAAIIVAFCIYRVDQWKGLSDNKLERAKEIAGILTREAAGRPVLFLGNSYWPFYPALSRADLKLASRFSSFYFLPGLDSDAPQAKPGSFSPVLKFLLGNRFQTLFEQRAAVLETVVDAIQADFERYRPRVIMISDESLPVRDKIMRHPRLAPIFATYEEYHETGGHRFLRKTGSPTSPSD